MHSLSHAQINQVRALYTKEGRQAHQAFIVEGEKLVQEVLKANLVIKELFTTDSTAQGQQIEEETMRRLSSVHTPSPVLAIVGLPVSKAWSPAALKGSLLCLDDIADPGNLGTMLRTADWFGVQTVVLGPDCVDEYNEKVVRASMGSLFHVQVYRQPLAPILQVAAKAGMPTIVTVLQNGNSTLPSAHPFCLVIGNEARGVQPELMQSATHSYTIPRLGEAESLNAGVALGVILAQLSL